MQQCQTPIYFWDLHLPVTQCRWIQAKTQLGFSPGPTGHKVITVGGYCSQVVGGSSREHIKKAQPCSQG